MSPRVLIHGASDADWPWHLTAVELRSWERDVIAPDLPREEESPGLPDFVDAVIGAVTAGELSI